MCDTISWLGAVVFFFRAGTKVVWTLNLAVCKTNDGSIIPKISNFCMSAYAFVLFLALELGERDCVHGLLQKKSTVTWSTTHTVFTSMSNQNRSLSQTFTKHPQSSRMGLRARTLHLQPGAGTMPKEKKIKQWKREKKNSNLWT